MSADVENLKSDIRSVLLASKDGVPAHIFNQEFSEMTMETLDVSKYGFASVHQLMCAIPDTVRIVSEAGGGVVYKVVDNEATAKLSQLVSKQKSKKRRGGGGGGGGMSKGGRARPTAIHKPPVHNRFSKPTPRNSTAFSHPSYNNSRTIVASSSAYSTNGRTGVLGNANSRLNAAGGLYASVNTCVDGAAWDMSGLSRNLPFLSERHSPSERMKGRLGPIPADNYCNEQQLSSVSNHTRYFQQIPAELNRHGNYDQHISDAREIIREHSSSNTSLQRTNSSNSGNRRPAIVDWRVNGHYEQDPYESKYEQILDVEREDRAALVIELSNKALTTNRVVHHNGTSKPPFVPLKTSPAGDSLDSWQESSISNDNREAFFQLPEQPKIKADPNQSLDAFFVHMVSPLKFFVHLENEEKVDELMSLCLQCSKVSTNVSKSELQDGQLLLYETRFDDSWCRAQMLPNNEVLMVDFGSRDPFEEHRAREMPKELTRYPVMIRQCKLANIQPEKGTWSADANKLMQDQCDGEELSIVVRELKYNSIAQKNPILIVDVTVAGVDLAEILEKAGYAKRTAKSQYQATQQKQSPGLSTIAAISPGYSKINNWFFQNAEICAADANKSELISLHEEQCEVAEKNIRKWNKISLKDDVDWASLLVPSLPGQEKDAFDCVLTHVKDDGTCYLQFSSLKGTEYLKELLLQVNEKTSLDCIRSVISQPECGNLYAVYDWINQIFARAIVTSVEIDYVTVFFIDHGHTVNVDIDFIRDSQPFQPAFSNLPCQVAPVKVANVEWQDALSLDYLDILMKEQRRLKCWCVNEFDQSTVNLKLSDGRILRDALEELKPKECYEGESVVYRDFGCSAHLHHTVSLFANSLHPFHQITPDQVLTHGHKVSFQVVALTAGRHMRVVETALGQKYFRQLSPTLEQACKELGQESANLSSLKCGSYFLVRCPVDNVYNSDENHNDVETKFAYHRCKLASHVEDFVFALNDIDSGEIVFAHRRNIFVLPSQFYGPDFPLVTWDASFIMSDKILDVNFVGQELECTAVYPTKTSVHFIYPDYLAF